jgi:hypothetical protein
LFWAGLGALLVDAVFLVVWQHIRVSNICRQRSAGIELGLLVSIAAFGLSMFGNGWKRVTLAVGAVVVTYLWFSWLLWMVQIC